MKLQKAVVRRFSIKNVLLKIYQNSQETPCARVSFLMRLQAGRMQLYLKETPGQVFPCTFCTVFKNTYLITGNQPITLLNNQKITLNDEKKLHSYSRALGKKHKLKITAAEN